MGILEVAHQARVCLFALIFASIWFCGVEGKLENPRKALSAKMTITLRTNQTHL